MVDDNRGYVINTNNIDQIIDDLASSYEQVINNVNEAIGKGRSAKEFISQYMTLNKLALDLDELYRSHASISTKLSG